ncbi:hypothetical protein WOLCODRAFT_76672 [Wolfiporia cocos MD-104 SS10]|uniref:HAUS augmin-like complex subunit 6 N-terminal domain-containing protein n=1 Tax=Wolfiporia cocos (strain MD-104) TaxID=742152 RepID=A0A2H3JX06_WOLCO|nr:hypothetical protein WOLCODRAFT_76672 [Wolfiporia cocos MD-104 SS10]
MEDISFFLVAKLERGRERAKSILPTYPCLQPSDTTSFRISLAKYLEALRHSGMHPTPSEHRGPGGAREQLRHTAHGVAWWWKDVVVRRSLLEECSGERFERLILALSTHALLKIISNPGSPSTLAEADASRRAV